MSETDNSVPFPITPNTHVRFSSQREDEDVIVVVRRVFITQIPWVVNAAILALLTLLANIFLREFLTTNQLIVVNLFSIFFIFSYVWVNYLLWFFTVGIITSERIVDLDFYHLIYKEFSATTIRKVSDITTKVGGFLGSILNYGDVFVKTEGFEQNIEFEDISHPQDIVKLINALMKKVPGSRRRGIT